MGNSNHSGSSGSDGVYLLMTSIRRRLTVPEVSALLDETAVNALLNEAAVNSLIKAATVNGLLTASAVNNLISNKLRHGVVSVAGETVQTVSIDKTIVGAQVCFYQTNDVDSSCGCTYAGSVLTVRNSSQSTKNIAYLVVVV